LTASLDSVTNTLNNNRDRAYANGFTVAFEDTDLGKMKTISEEKTGLMWRHDFGWKNFRDPNSESSCLKLTID
jgi:hypothetical protein